MARQPEGPAPAPAVQRLRIHYAKRGRLRFSSHRDFQRAFERALRRSRVPMAYSAGFSPHPKVSYAGAAATGVASEAEYLEIALTERVDPVELRTALDTSLPPGLDVLEIVEAGPGGLVERLTAATAFLAAEEVAVERLTKNGIRRFDARAAVVALDPVERAGVLGEGPCAILRLVVRHFTPAVRPDDVLAGLRQVAALQPPSPPAVVRLAQGPLDETAGAVGDPLAADRDAVGALERPDVQP
jgi:hypothetical protein